MVQTTLFKVAEVELKYSADYKIADRPKISSSASAYEVLLQQWNLLYLVAKRQYMCR